MIVLLLSSFGAALLDPAASAHLLSVPTPRPPAAVFAQAEAAPATSAATPAPAPAPATATATASGSSATERFRLLVLDFKGNDVETAVVKTLQGLVATGLAEYPELDVVSGDDLKNLVQLQAEKDSMGCSEDASCMAEIADALGAQLVVFGSAGRLGDDLVLNVNLFDTQRATGLGRIVVQGSDTTSLPRKLRPKLRDLVGKFYTQHHLTLPPYVEPPPEVAEAPAPSPLPWIVAAGGAGAFLVGGTVLGLGLAPLLQYNDAKGRALAAEGRFATEPSALADAKAAQADLADARASWNGFGYLAVDVGAVLTGAGLVTGVAGLIWLLTDDETVPSGAPAPTAAPASSTEKGAAQ